MAHTNEKLKKAITLIREDEDDFNVIDNMHGFSNRRLELLCIRNDLEAFLNRLEPR